MFVIVDGMWMDSGKKVGLSILDLLFFWFIGYSGFWCIFDVFISIVILEMGVFGGIGLVF